MKPSDYKALRLHNITSKKFRHLFFLLFWPLYGLAFSGVEFLFPNDSTYTIIHHPIDDMIPFCEWFAIPYVFWYACLAFMVVYPALYDVPLFKKYMWFIILGYSVSFITYLVFPNGQLLRPDLEALGRENLMTELMGALYASDTYTNVCPSMHVIGALAVMFASWHSKHFSSWYWNIISTVNALLICISTVFVKQHSIVDVWAGTAVSIVLYVLIFHVKWNKIFTRKDGTLKAETTN